MDKINVSEMVNVSSVTIQFKNWKTSAINNVIYFYKLVSKINKDVLYLYLGFLQEKCDGRDCVVYGGLKRCVEGFGRIPEEKRPFGIPRHRCENNIKMDLQEVV
jgi:hypothetical protein